jgi:hypothetical protein
VNEHGAKYCRVRSECLRQHLATLQVFQQSSQYIAKAAFFHGVAQVAQAIEQRNPGTGDVAHVDAEGDQIAPRDALAALRRILP